MELRMVTETNLFHLGESSKTNNLKVAEGLKAKLETVIGISVV
jgi:hypothetical protein